MVAEHKKKKNTISLLKVLTLMAVLVVQIFRIFGTCFLFYYVFYKIVFLQEQSYLLDRGNETISNNSEDTVNDTEDYFIPAVVLLETKDGIKNVSDQVNGEVYEEPEDPATDFNEAWDDALLASVAAVEVMATVFFIWLIVGPLSNAFTMRHWMRWILKMRIFWMRLIWTATAVFYAVATYFYKEQMYKLTKGEPNQKQYELIPAWFVMLAFSCLEFFFLGILECVLKIITSDKVLRKIRKSSKKLPKIWKKIQVRSYHLTLFAFALRNFSLSLYFGLLSVFVSFDDLIAKNRLAGLTLVLQIYLAMVRGRFYGLFMHAFLSIFLVEEDDEMYKEIQQAPVSDDFIGDNAEKSLLEEKPSKNINNFSNSSASSTTGV